MPAGVEETRWVRPSIVAADPELMTSAPLPKLAASAMNAMAHAMEALYTPAANPVNDSVALRAASLIGSGLGADGERLALGGLLAGIASGNAGIALHHAVCQTVVRVAGSPHAETNAVVLPHSARFVAPRAPAALTSLAAALGSEDAGSRLAELSALCGVTRLAELGVSESQLPAVVDALGDHRGLALTPGGSPSSEELLDLLRAAF
jgi:alcohol dehydrogenase class IV